MWKCASCNEILEPEFDSCWKCGSAKRGAEGKTKVVENHLKESGVAEFLREEALRPRPSSGASGCFAIVLLIVGLAIFVCGLISINSLESQVTRLSGRSDGLGLFLLSVGGLLALVGGLIAFSPTKTIVHISDSDDEPENLSSSPPEQVELLERLATLKERGAITDDEFQTQKKRILG